MAYQSGMVAVEGSADRDVQVETSLRKVDVGELADAEPYQPGRRLLGAFGYGGGAAEIQLLVTRPDRVQTAEPPIGFERAELLTMVSASGQSQTAARFRLRCGKAALAVEVQLPAGSTLWAAFFGCGMPTYAATRRVGAACSSPCRPKPRLGRAICNWSTKRRSTASGAWAASI